MNKLNAWAGLLARYLRYYFRAGTKYGVHSPFVADWVANVLEDNRDYYAFFSIEGLRQTLSRSGRRLAGNPGGAGYFSAPAGGPSLSYLANRVAVPPYVGQWLFKTALWAKPKSMLELGSSLGISTLYLGAAAPRAQFLSVEGWREAAELAATHCHEAGLANIRIVHGNFGEALPQLLPHLAPLDLIYIDGDHNGFRTLEYVEQCLPHLAPDGVIVLGDIYWSADMAEAWKTLRQHPAFRVSIDVFHLGLLFPRAEQKEKEHFTLIRARRKFWRVGIWG